MGTMFHVIQLMQDLSLIISCIWLFCASYDFGVYLKAYRDAYVDDAALPSLEWKTTEKYVASFGYAIPVFLIGSILILIGNAIDLLLVEKSAEFFYNKAFNTDSDFTAIYVIAFAGIPFVHAPICTFSLIYTKLLRSARDKRRLEKAIAKADAAHSQKVSIPPKRP